ncbi:craniofacial development protein 2-like [Schistocerca americana]|uniref:craniofacial development protein 2-like n=1 Tax=Schistocerca americana TaxID=7009 RepID=UPI001F4FC4F7|nr:craniofacial development protein 2-like [Schistocerca americana]
MIKQPFTQWIMNDKHEQGVGLVIGQKVTKTLIGWNPVNDRIITVCFHSTCTKTTVVQVYAPVEDSNSEDRDAFYDQLHDVFDEILCHDHKVLLANMTALLGNNGDCFQHVVGPFVIVQCTNDNVACLRLFYNLIGLCTGNSYFQYKMIHKKI